ncbi:hypothetical protein ACX3UL_09505 [Actinomyces urogenitalis]
MPLTAAPLSGQAPLIQVTIPTGTVPKGMTYTVIGTTPTGWTWDDQDDTPTTLRDQTPEAIALHAIYNLLVHALGGKQTWPEPVTAVDQAREDLAIEKAWDVIAVMTPWARDR